MIKKFTNKVKSAVCSVKAAVMSRKAEGYVDSGVKILIAVVIGALLLGGLYLLFNGIKRINKRLTVINNRCRNVNLSAVIEVVKHIANHVFKCRRGGKTGALEYI